MRRRYVINAVSSVNTRWTKKTHKVKPEKDFLIYCDDFSNNIIGIFEKLKKFMKFNLGKFCSSNFDKNIAIKEEEVRNVIDKEYDVG